MVNVYCSQMFTMNPIAFIITNIYLLCFGMIYIYCITSLSQTDLTILKSTKG